LALRISRPAQASFTCPFPQPGQVLCRFRPALQRKSGPRIALPAHRLYYLVNMWPRSTTRGFWRSPRCSVIAQRARVQQRPSHVLATASVSSCMGRFPGRAEAAVLRVCRYIASRLPEVRGRACAGAASASYASYRSDSMYIYTACLAKRRAGPVAGAAWSCGGPICVFSTDFERSRRGVHAHRVPLL
jgi:hypothetical protein